MQPLIGRAVFPTQSFICLAQPHYASSNAPAPKRAGPCTWRCDFPPARRAISGAEILLDVFLSSQIAHPRRWHLPCLLAYRGDGGAGAPHDLHLGSGAGPARVCTEGQWKTSSARHSRADGPLPPGAGPARVGTRMGGPVRTQVVWVPAGSWLRRRDRLAVHHAERPEQTSVDRRCRPVGGVRQN